LKGCAMDLRDYQIDACDQAFSCLTNDKQSKPVICLPTGAGKSVVIAELCRRALVDWNGFIVVLQHRKELVEQNADKIAKLCGSKSVGIYQASLKRRDLTHPIIVAGINSIYDKASMLGKRHLVIVDEAHMISDDEDSMYSKFISSMPGSRLLGLTATPYRTSTGRIYGKDRQFDKFIEPKGSTIPELIDRGMLSKMVSKIADASVDTSDLSVRGGEFIKEELESLFGGSEVDKACSEIVQRSQGRKSIIVFCTGVAHALAVKQKLETSISPCEIIHGKTSPGDRESIIESFRLGITRCVVNVDVLTTGFDAPNIDCVAILRATMSPGLYAQMVGRGLRTAPSKQDCLVLDFGENIKRHGPIDAINCDTYGRSGKGKKDDIEQDEKEPSKGRICYSCEVEAPSDALICECGATLPLVIRHSERADIEAEIVGGGADRFFDVQAVYYSITKKPSGPQSMIVHYVVSQNGKTMLPAQSPLEFVSFESDKEFALERAKAWWKRRSDADFPSSTEQAIEIAKAQGLKKPSSILARKSGPFWEITAGVMR
jgi:DNA repair protein RadD